jgi:hypothetical protein
MLGTLPLLLPRVVILAKSRSTITRRRDAVVLVSARPHEDQTWRSWASDCCSGPISLKVDSTRTAGAFELREVPCVWSREVRRIASEPLGGVGFSVLRATETKLLAQAS